MNSTVEQIARDKCVELYDPDHVTIRVKTSWSMGFCLPDEGGKDEEMAVFATMTFGDNYAIERATSYDIEVGRKITGQAVFEKVTDLNEYRRLIVKRNLVSWSLDIPIERDSTGWMTSGCYARVSRVPAPLMDAFIRGFEDSVEISEEEETRISRQCAQLFSKSGQGVSDACEAVSRFCTLGNFSEKFGINRDLLPRLPYREFLLLKIMMAKESESLRVQGNRGGAGGGTKIVGPGGKPRASRGIHVPLPGSG